MLSSKIIALLISLCTAGGIAVGTGSVNKAESPITYTQVQRQISVSKDNGQAVAEVPVAKTPTVNDADKSNETTASQTKITENVTNSASSSKQAEDVVKTTTVTSNNTQSAAKTTTVPKTTTKPATAQSNTKTTTATTNQTTTAAKPAATTKTTTQTVTKPAAAANTQNTTKTTTGTTAASSSVPANPNNKSFKYLDAVEKEILTLVNAERAKASLKPLVWEESMRNIARYKSNNMLQYSYFSHNTPSLNNAGPFDLATKYFKYSTNSYGENIYYNMGYSEAQDTAKLLVDSWMNSPGHRANILNPNWTKMAAGVVYSSNGKICYATQHFSGK